MVYRFIRTFLALLLPCAATMLLSCGSHPNSTMGETNQIAAAEEKPIMPSGGFVEKVGTALRPRWTSDVIQALVPSDRRIGS